MILLVKVLSNARSNALDSFQDGVLKVRIHAPPDKGKANEMLIEFLADQLKIAKSRITIVSGHTNRLKKIKIEGNFSIEKLNLS